jgi:hypothetical protein
MLSRPDLKPAVIKGTVREIVLGNPSTWGSFQAYQLTDAVMEKLRASRDEMRDTGIRAMIATKIRLALDDIAGEGVLVKIGIGQVLPWGQTADRTCVYYFTPEGYAKAIGAAAARKRYEDVIDERRQDVNSRLAAIGITRNGDGSLTLDDLEKLLDRAGL